MKQLKIKYLDSLEPPQREQVFAQAHQAAQPVTAWSLRFPLVRSTRIFTCCLHAAASVPFFSAAQVAGLAKIYLWVFAIDDLVDEQLATPELIQLILQDCKLLLAGASTDRSMLRSDYPHHICACLDEIIAEMDEYPMFSKHGARWASSVGDYISTCGQETRWNARFCQDGNDLPSLGDYLSNGALSISVPIFSDTVIIMSGDQSAIDKHAWLRKMSRQAGSAIRLANDYQTHHRELTEHKVNSLIIQQAAHLARGLDGSAAAKAARHDIAMMIQHEIASCEAMYAEERTDSGYPEKAIINNVRFSCDFYDKYDFHNAI